MRASSTSTPPSASVGRSSAAGLGLRLHAEQLARTGAAELGVRLGAASVDHLEQLDEAGVRALGGLLDRSRRCFRLRPSCCATACRRRARCSTPGATVALASDANAGTFGGFGAMPLVVGLGATLLGMTVTEALTAATAGGAAALRARRPRACSDRGAAADLVAWDAEHEGAFALRLGSVRPLRVWIAGEEVALSG